MKYCVFHMEGSRNIIFFFSGLWFGSHNVISSKQNLLNVPLGNDNTEHCSFSAPAAPYPNHFYTLYSHKKH